MRYLPLVIFFFTLSITAQEQFEVFFDFNKSEINFVSKQKLENWINSSNDFEVTKIYGYCDWKGSNSYNDTLSLKRVHSVYDFLIKSNIKVMENYEVLGFGENFNQSKNQSENRKVIIFFQNKVKNINPSNKLLEVKKTLTEQVKSAKVGDLLVLDNIYFKNRSSVIVPSSKTILYDLLCILEENPNLKIQIQGHICCQLVSDFEDISTRRARAVYIFLIQNKIDRRRLSYKGFGVTKPIHPIPEKTEAQANENRRVEIMIVEN